MSATNVARAGKQGNICVGNNVSSFARAFKLLNILAWRKCLFLTLKKADNGKATGAVFIDLSKAFDTISYSVLLSKLSRYGVYDKELKWFTDYLFLRKQIVQFNGILSEPNPINTGVPQGASPFSHLL